MEKISVKTVNYCGKQIEIKTPFVLTNSVFEIMKSANSVAKEHTMECSYALPMSCLRLLPPNKNPNTNEYEFTVEIKKMLNGVIKEEVVRKYTYSFSDLVYEFFIRKFYITNISLLGGLIKEPDETERNCENVRDNGGTVMNEKPNSPNMVTYRNFIGKKCSAFDSNYRRGEGILVGVDDYGWYIKEEGGTYLICSKACNIRIRE